MCLVPGKHLFQNSACICGYIFSPHCLLSLVATIIFWQPIAYFSSLVRGVCLIEISEFLWKFSRNTYRGWAVWIPSKRKKKSSVYFQGKQLHNMNPMTSISNSTCYCNYCNPSGQSAQLCHSWLILGGAEPLLFLRWRNYTNYMSQHAEIHIVTILPVTGWLVLYFSIMQFSSLAVKQIFLNLFRVN